MRIIKIFISGSLREYKRERSELMDFFRSMNEVYAKNGTHLDCYAGENISKQLTPSETQEDFANFIRESNLFLLLIGESIGAYTLRELELAVDSFSNTGSPIILAFAHEFDHEDNQPMRSSSIAKIRNRGIYCKYFKNIDTVKLSILLNLQKILFEISDSGISKRYSTYSENTEKAVMTYQEMLNKYRRMARIYQDMYTPKIAEVCHELSLLLSKSNRKEEAEMYDREALDIFRRLSDSSPSEFMQKQGEVLAHLASILFDTNRVSEAEMVESEATKTYESLFRRDPEKFISPLMQAYNMLASMTRTVGNYDYAEAIYRKALTVGECYFENKPNDDKTALASTYYNLGLLISRELNDYDSAKQYFENAMYIFDSQGQKTETDAVKTAMMRYS